MDRTALSPLLRSFERHLRAANRSERTIASYLESPRHAEAFFAARGKGLAEAGRADLEAFPTPEPARPTAVCLPPTGSEDDERLLIRHICGMRSCCLSRGRAAHQDPGVDRVVRSVLDLTL
jgi:hypothetical protein